MSIEKKSNDGGNIVFQYYVDGELWYRTASGEEFPAAFQGERVARYSPRESASQSGRNVDLNHPLGLSTK